MTQSSSPPLAGTHEQDSQVNPNFPFLDTVPPTVSPPSTINSGGRTSPLDSERRVESAAPLVDRLTCSNANCSSDSLVAATFAHLGITILSECIDSPDSNVYQVGLIIVSVTKPCKNITIFIDLLLMCFQYGS